MKIVDLETYDVRFPTSDDHAGSDATNKDPDYSAAYIIIRTSTGLEGHGLVFTIGRGNEIVCQAMDALRPMVRGWNMKDITHNVGAFYAHLKSDSQLQWLGPEKGVVHMAIGGVMNALWDLWARTECKPLWQLLVDMTPQEFINCIDFRYIEDAITREEALEHLEGMDGTKYERVEKLKQHGYPAYTTSAGWLGYSNELVAKLCREAVAEGFQHIKLKVGESLDDDKRRCAMVRQTVGDDIHLMIDANQRWGVSEAIEWVSQLQEFRPWFIEEPTSPDDVYGHQQIKRALNGVQVATGEHCQNRVLFKQFIMQDALDIVQIDACRLASINEILAVYMMANKFGKPVCPHAGGVGLCEYVQHLAFIDYARISGTFEDRVVEYVDHLHEHFVDPCIVKNGAYQLSTQPGYSVKFKPNVITDYGYPAGKQWQERALRSRERGAQVQFVEQV